MLYICFARSYYIQIIFGGYRMKLLLKSSLLFCLVLAITTPSSAFFWKKDSTSYQNITKQAVIGHPLPFSEADFLGSVGVVSFDVIELPKIDFGTLYMGHQPIKTGENVSISALSGLVYQPTKQIGETQFKLLPSLADGSQGDSITITIHNLEAPNGAPLAKNMELYTYTNIEITSYFDVLDAEGDRLTFQITSPSARGAVTLAEDGSSRFIYQPYENKTGNDSFRYTVTDAVGNISNEATVTIRINKPTTSVNYSDMDGHIAHKSAIRLAEEGVFVGESVGTTYLFQPDTPVTRDEFLSLTMAITGLDPLEEVETTGFYDDDSIPTWAKGYVSSALLAGVVQGSLDENGRAVFQANEVITQGEANVILDKLLTIKQAETSDFDHFSGQATANLLEVGVNSCTSLSFSEGLTRSEVAQLLDETLAVVHTQTLFDSWFKW